MTALDRTLTNAPVPRTSVASARAWLSSRRRTVEMGLLTALVLIITGLVGGEKSVHLILADGTEWFGLPSLTIDPRTSGIAVAALLLGWLALDGVRGRSGHALPTWTAVPLITVAMGWMVIALAGGADLPLVGVLQGAVALSVPLIFGALSGVTSERAGVVNVAIEGQLLAGAFTSAAVGLLTGSPFAGLIAAGVAGAAVSSVLAFLSTRHLVDQVIVGVVLNVLVTGLTSFLFAQGVGASGTASPPRLTPIDVPLLSGIPVVGPVLFHQTVIVYIMYATVALIWFALFRTRWGLRVRSVGEYPQAADSVGINVLRLRIRTVLLAGAIAGVGGAYFTLGSVGGFSKEITAGAGYIALAAVIFGRWDPIKATLAALFFGLANSVQSNLAIIGSPIPSEVLLMSPYVLTLLAVSGLVAAGRPPRAAGKPFVR
ncbi:ABC transporter permease [Streptomyces sp. NPDC059477]|uniref:ABC transporter permease n=1 Tax=Streptomyces sp. NPDC059477 TaxID=3346847 RepID=UPI0036875530